MKVLLKKEVCGSREQCTRPNIKVETHFSKKKKKDEENANANAHKLYPNVTIMLDSYNFITRI